MMTMQSPFISLDRVCRVDSIFNLPSWPWYVQRLHAYVRVTDPIFNRLGMYVCTTVACLRTILTDPFLNLHLSHRYYVCTTVACLPYILTDPFLNLHLLHRYYLCMYDGYMLAYY